MAHNHIHIDPALPLVRQADKGHNRWHPDIAPAVRIASGSSVEMETLDGLDGQIKARTTAADLAAHRDGSHPSADRTGACRRRRAGRSSCREDRADHPGKPGLHHDHAGLRLPARSLHHAFPGALGDGERLCRLAATARRAHSRRAVHGRDGRGAFARAAGAYRGPRGRSGGTRRHGDAAGRHGRGADSGRHRRQGDQDHRAARERRQLRHQVAHRRRHALSAGAGAGRAVLGRRRAFRAGRRRILRHRGRDLGDLRGPLRRAEGRGDATPSARSLVRIAGTCPPRRAGRARRPRCDAQQGLLRDDGHVAARRRSSRIRGHHARGAQRAGQHDRLYRRCLQPHARAGLLPGERRRRSAHQPGRRRAEHDGIGRPAARHLRR